MALADGEVALRTNLNRVNSNVNSNEGHIMVKLLHGFSSLSDSIPTGERLH